MKTKNINIIFSIVLVITVCVTAFVVVRLHNNGKKEESIPVNVESTTYEQIRADGFYKDGAEWVYYENGRRSVRTDLISGCVDDEESWWYVKDGVVDFSHNALYKNDSDNGWWLIRNGKATQEDSDTIALKASEFLNAPQNTEGINTLGGFVLSEDDKTSVDRALKKIEDNGYEAGLFVMDINTLQGFTYNADVPFYSASTVKAPYIVSVVKSNNSVLEREKSSIKSILKYSSNSSYASLRTRYGNDCFYYWTAEMPADIEEVTSDYYQDLSPRQLAHMWFKSYFFFESSETGALLGEMLEEPEISPINKALSDKHKTRSKAGWYDSRSLNVTNDAGIVYTDDRTYLIVVMTTAPSDYEIVEELVKSIDAVMSK